MGVVTGESFVRLAGQSDGFTRAAVKSGTVLGRPV